MGNDLSRFGVWLNKELNEQKATEIRDEYKVSKNVQIGFLLGHMMAFGEIWTKLAFRDLPIQHFHDFGTLKFIEHHVNPTKKEIADDSMVEQSSCFEALKRLNKNGLLVDEVDKTDKRAKRVKLTKKGKETILRAMQQSYALSDLLVGDLIDEEKDRLIELLGKLNHFHEDLYRTTDKTRVIKGF